MKATFTLALAALAALAGLAALGVACSPQAAEPATPPPRPTAVLDSGAPMEAGEASARRAPVRVQILAFNDLHGYLEPPAGSTGYVVAKPDDPIASLADAGVRMSADGGAALVPAGGAAYLATFVRRLREQNPNTFFVSAGDLTGASPLLSNLFDDEPTVLVMNHVGLDFEGVGNHDFDRGLGELERLAHGGAAGAEEATSGGHDAGRPAFPGAKFEYLAANVTRDGVTGTVLPPYAIREVAGVKIAFIGVTLEETASVTKADAVKGLSSGNEIATVNALVPELRKRDVSAIILLVHQGGFQDSSGTYDSCEGFSGTLDKLLIGGPDRLGLDPSVDVVASGHTHQAYNCVIDGRLVTSAASYGRVVTKIDLVIDPDARRVVEKHARNIAITRDVPPDPEVLSTIAAYRRKAAPSMNRIVGYVKEDFVSKPEVVGSQSCETPLGDLIADAQLAATHDARHGKADIAFMNPGGIRADLLARQQDRPLHAVTYADAFEVQPFGNDLVTMSLTGTQIRTLLQAQFQRDRPRLLQPSEGFGYSYRYDLFTRKATIDTWSVRLRGVLVDPEKTYRVTVSMFLAEGGDDFDTFKQGTLRTNGGRDLEALTGYLQRNSSARAPLAPRPLGRVVGNACK